MRGTGFDDLNRDTVTNHRRAFIHAGLRVSCLASLPTFIFANCDTRRACIHAALRVFVTVSRIETPKPGHGECFSVEKPLTTSSTPHLIFVWYETTMIAMVSKRLEPGPNQESASRQKSHDDTARTC